MSRFVAVVDVDAPVQAVWDRLTDWPSHTRWVPLTTVRVLTPSATGVGARFVGRTSLAALGLDRAGFDDTMEVTQWLPPGDGLPGRCGIRKLGRVVRGSAAFDVVALLGPAHAGGAGLGAGGAAPRTRVLWEADLDLPPRPLTRLLAPLVSLAGRLAYTGALRRMAREVVAERPRP